MTNQNEILAKEGEHAKLKLELIRLKLDSFVRDIEILKEEIQKIEETIQ